jgi:AcrR family transcriptional regulator
MGVRERRARERENLRQEILDAAREMFVREGYGSVSIRKIAEKVEHSPGTLYLHFQDKAEILHNLCAETFSKLHKRLEAIEKDSSDPFESLRRGLLSYIRFGLENPSEYTVTFILPSPEDIAEKAKADSPGFDCFKRLRDIVQRCIDAGSIASKDAEETAQALWAGVHGITSLLVAHGGFPFVEETRLVERVVAILLEGVRKH